MKVMGIHAGRKNGNSSVLLKEALLVCRESGAEVTMINLHDFNIKYCTGCESCTKNMAMGGKKPFCVWDGKDDMDLIMKEFLVQDGVIIAVPTYDLMPAGIYISFTNRFLPYEAAFLKEIGVKGIKDRVGAVISMGGSTRAWQSMALEGIQATMFTQSIQIVDQILGTKCTNPGAVVLQPDLIERARLLGKNLVKAIHTPVEKREWLGDKNDGWCPVCHSNSLSLGEPHWDGVQWPVECQVCGAGGDIQKDENGKWKFVVAENGLLKCRTIEKGRALHMYEIQAGMKKVMENKEIIKEKMEKYKNISFPSIK
ncbi:MAG: flavodoxin family protein [Spirochaetes bacterium]|nr:flavodoxin family protein [Spirochaetota bacterium]